MNNTYSETIEQNQLSEFVENFLAKNGNNIILFIGEVGAGKTTTIKEICKQLNIEDKVTSPSYSVVNEYYTQNNELVYHFDFYRLNNIEEAFDIGIEDMFYSDKICLIEWPELIEDHLPKVKTTIEIKVIDDKKREFIVTFED